MTIMKGPTPGEKAKRAAAQANHDLEQRRLKADYDLELIKKHFPSFDETKDYEAWPSSVRVAIENTDEELEAVRQIAQQAANDKYKETFDREYKARFEKQLALVAAEHDPD